MFESITSARLNNAGSCPQRGKRLFLLFCCLFLFAVVLASAAARSPQRTKRGLLELAGAIKCSTGRSALAYMMYGCYCGLGGQGWPRDKADWWGSSRNHTPVNPPFYFCCHNTTPSHLMTVCSKLQAVSWFYIYITRKQSVSFRVF